MLRILAEHIFDRKKIHLNKRVFKVDHSTECATVFCTDGSSYHGDIIAGADGVSSKVRREMWRAANSVKPGSISEKEMTCKFSYAMLYDVHDSKVTEIKVCLQNIGAFMAYPHLLRA